MAYIDPITGAYVADSLDALPPGYNQPKAGNEANVAKMRAALNNSWDNNEPLPNLERPATDPFSLIKQAYQHMPGAALPQASIAALSDMLGGTVGNLYGVGKQALSGELGNPEAGNQAYADAQRLAQALHYQPPTQAGQDIYNAYNRIGEVTGPLPELWNTRMRFTPDDLHVLGKTATEDFRNFGSDYANAKAGVQREYPTAGSRAAQFTDVAGDMVRPMAEKAYDMYMNPRDAESFGINPVSNLSGLAPSGGPMYAVKPKGGNWPTNLGSTLPLKEQGELGEHLSKIQINDPVDAFENQLKKHHAGYLDTHRLETAWKEFLQTYLADHEPEIRQRIKSANDIKREAAQQFTENFNIEAVNQEPAGKFLNSPSQIEAIAPAYNSWVMGPYQKYLTNQYATGVETDPLLQVIEKLNPPIEVLKPYTPEPSDFDIRSAEDRRSASMQRYQRAGLDLSDPRYANIGKQTAVTPAGQRAEMAMDRSVYPSVYQISNFDDTDKYPGGTKLNKNAVISDLLSVPEESLLPSVRKKVLNDLLSGKMSPDKLANALPANVAQQIIKDYQAEQQSKANVQKAKDTWRQARFNDIQSAVPYSDGSKIQVITKEDANTNENLVLRDLGQSTIDLNQCIGAGCHNTADYPSGHGPFIEPHTGKSPKGAYKYEDTHVKRYMERLKKGETEIARLLDSNGVAQASVELRVRDPKDVKGDAVAHREFIKDWLQQNDNNTYTIVMDQGFSGSGNTKAALFAKHPDLEKAFDAYFRPVAEKEVYEMKGKNNGEILPEYMPQMVEWLNSMGDQLTDVRDFDKLPDVVDLNKTYDSLAKIYDKHPHWDANTVEDFLDKVTDEKLLPRFFTGDDFALKATELGVDLSDAPKRKGTQAVQEAYEKLSQQLRLTYEEPYLQEYINGDPDVVQSINNDIYSHPQQYGVGNFLGNAIIQAVQRLENEGLHRPGRELENLAQQFEAEPGTIDEAYQGVLAEIPNQWNMAFVNAINGNDPTIRRTLANHMENNLNTYNLRDYPAEIRDAIIRQIAQQGIPEFGNAQISRLDVDDRDVLDMGMDHYFDNPNDPDFQVPVGRPTQLIRILAGNQNNGHAQLPRIAHQQLVNYLLNQDDHVADIVDLRERLQRGDHFLNGAQADNMLRILTEWLQEFPLRGEEGIRQE
jgi:hypothetical protein